jgi:hypothetical protein
VPLARPQVHFLPPEILAYRDLPVPLRLLPESLSLPIPQPQVHFLPPEIHDVEGALTWCNKQSLAPFSDLRLKV